MHLHFSPEDEAFRREIAGWLERELGGEFKALRGAGGPGNENELVEERRQWERRLGAAGWACIGWPREWGGRGAPLSQQVIFHEEYARARTRPPRTHRRGAARADAAGLRERRTEASISSRHRPRRGDLVPGLLRAERGLRPRERADARPARGR